MARRKEVVDHGAIRVHYTQEYPRCEWEDGSDCCRFPGTMSTDTTGSGPWYCSVHFQCPDPVFGSRVVEASRDYVHETAKKLQEEQTKKEAREFCELRGLNNLDEMRAWIKANHPTSSVKKHNVDWAKKVMERLSDGESMPSISVEKAKIALGIKDEIS